MIDPWERDLIRQSVLEGRRLDAQISALKAQRKELTIRALAEKFERNTRTIRLIANGTRGMQ